MRLLALRLAVALGLRELRPLSEGQVRAILRRWASLRRFGARDGALGMPRGGGTEEPSWVIWCGTINAKLGRLPRHQTPAFRGWECSGPELEARVNELLDDEVGEVEHLRWKAIRAGELTRHGHHDFGIGRNTGRAREIRTREAQIDRVREALGELRWSRVYGEAMLALRWELAEAMEDPSFARADRMLQELEA